MTRLVTTLCTTTALIAAGPSLAATQSNDEVSSSFCHNVFMEGDVNQDDLLSVEEIKALRDMERDAIDTDDDQEISREEYVECLKQSFESALEEAEQTGDRVGDWSDLGLEENNELSGEDFAELAEKAWQDSPEAANKAFTYKSEQPQTKEEFANAAVEHFRMQDKNNDGVLSKSEYETPARDAQWDEAAVNQRFDELDADNSGAISPQEYRAGGMTVAMPKTTTGNTEAAQDTGMKDDGQVVPVIYYYFEVY